MKRFLNYCAFAAIAAALLAVAVWGSGYLWSMRGTAAPDLPGVAELRPDAKIPLGGETTAVLEFRLPVYRRVLKATAAPGKGSTVAGAVRIESVWRWNQSVWRVEAPLRAFRSGQIPPGALTLELSPAKRGGETVEFSAVIPDLAVEPGENRGGDLALAGEMTPGRRAPSKHWLWLLLALPAAWWFWNRTHRTPAPRPPTPWETAFGALGALRKALLDGTMLPEAGFARLTDLVRRYLEERFRLPVSTRTTPEFLDNLDRLGEASPLPAEQRPFLKEFLTAADLVKFAKAPPDANRLDHAISRAEELVEKTRPVSPDQTAAAGEEPENSEVRHV